MSDGASFLWKKRILWIAAFIVLIVTSPAFAEAVHLKLDASVSGQSRSRDMVGSGVERRCRQRSFAPEARARPACIFDHQDVEQTNAGQKSWPAALSTGARHKVSVDLSPSALQVIVLEPVGSSRKPALQQERGP